MCRCATKMHINILILRVTGGEKLHRQLEQNYKQQRESETEPSAGGLTLKSQKTKLLELDIKH